MPNIFNTLDLVTAAIAGISLPKFLRTAKVNIDEDHITLNYIPQNRENLLSNNLVNVNLFVNKVNGIDDLSKIETYYEQIRQAIESYTAQSSVGYYSFSINSEPLMADYENTNFTLLNTRVTVTNNYK